MPKTSPVFIMAQSHLIPTHTIISADYTALETGIVTIHCENNKTYKATGFDAIEAVYILKPGVLEGRRLRWQRGVWAWHNMVIHPLMQIYVWLGYKKKAIALHDISIPKPVGFRDI